MALYGGSRDVSLLRNINREVIHDIISQQAAFYKYELEETNTNIYGEASGTKYYIGPVLLPCLIARSDQEFPESDLGVDFNWGIEFRFLRDDLVDANVVPEVGDIILYQKGYYQVDETNSNQYFVGKNPDYPNEGDDGVNPLGGDLSEFGYNITITCKTHYVPADKVGITQERL